MRENMQKAVVQMNASLAKMGEFIRRRRYERLGISFGVAPGPFPGSIDIDVGPVRPPSL